jgi:EAL domain-containing protein (putative c-di-GMP-specific phosphodiesterase class I)
VRAVARELGGIAVDAVPSGRAALARLIDPTRPYSRVLMNPARDDGLLRDILGLTCDEQGSGSELLLLGRSAAAPPHVCVVSAPQRAAIRSALTRGCGCRHVMLPSILELRGALAERRIEPHYQPLVHLADRQPAGVEALARLHRGRLPMLAPEHFVPRIEAAGLASDLTELVLIRSFADMMSDTLSPHGFNVALNFPLDVLMLPDAVERLEALRRRSGIAAEQVAIELTESRVVTDLPPLRRVVGRLRDAGYGVALDDVSPAMLHQEALLHVPFSAVKLDRQIVQRAAVSRDAAVFIRRIIDIAKSRGATVIAEGVEDVQTWHRVRGAGVDLAQGFIVGRPLPAAALPAWIENWQGRSDLD